MRKIFNLDGWQNVLTGLGNSATDKTEATTWATSVQPSDEMLEGVFYESGIASRIVQTLPHSALRQGVEFIAPVSLAAEQREIEESRLRERMFDLQVLQAVYEARVWGRLFGGGVILVDDGAPSLADPADKDTQQPIRFLRVFDKRDVRIATVYSDLREPGYGEPESFSITATASSAATTWRVHASRVIILPGELTTNREYRRLMYWDSSVLRRVISEIRDYSTTWTAVGNMLQDASQGVLKIKRLWEILAGQFRQQFEDRLAIMAAGRWSGKIMPIDSEEEFEISDRTFGNVPEMLDRYKERIAMAIGWPISVLAGQAPAGLNATGESDMRLWYDLVRIEQNDVLTHPIETIVYMLARELGLTEPENWRIKWPSLWQETPAENASRQYQVAQVDQVYLDRGVLSPDEVATARYGSGEWSDRAPSLDMELRMLRAKIEVENANSPTTT